MPSIKVFLKNQIVLVVSGIAAVISCFFVPPSPLYLSYVNFRVLALLFCLMCVVAGMKDAGAFNVLSRVLLKNVHSTRALALLLVIVSFMLSMFLTNDVTLITVVPFTLLVFAELDAEQELLYTLVLETVAANLGSMLMPFGNPQNLYLFSRYDFSLAEFLVLMLPCTIFSLVLVTAATCCLRNRKIAVAHLAGNATWMDVKAFALYAVLFVLSILSVVRVLPWQVLLVLVIGVLLWFKRSILLRADYALLVTFVFFFVFVGNMGNIPAVRTYISQFMHGHELAAAVVVSQFVSNVPAALLLSAFTEDGRALALGTNIGGLGTLIASMASLITFRFYAAARPQRTRRYLLVFTLANILFLLLLSAFAFILEH